MHVVPSLGLAAGSDRLQEDAGLRNQLRKTKEREENEEDWGGAKLKKCAQRKATS